MEKRVSTAARLPDPFVREMPMVTDPLQQARQIHPEVMGDGGTVFIIEIHRIHQLAVDIKLELLVGIVPNADGRGLLVALEMREDLFREDVPPVDAIHHLERPVWSEFT